MLEKDNSQPAHLNNPRISKLAELLYQELLNGSFDINELLTSVEVGIKLYRVEMTRRRGEFETFNNGTEFRFMPEDIDESKRLEKIRTDIRIRKVIEVLMMADGHCAECAYYQIEHFIVEFPEYATLAKQMYEAKFKMEYGDVEK